MPLAAERSGLTRGVIVDVGAAPPELWGHHDCGGAIDPCEGGGAAGADAESSAEKGPR